WSSRYKGDNPGLNIFAMIVSAPVMLAVYYVCEGILYSNWVAPAASIPGNITQNVVGILVAIPVGIALKKTRFFRSFR
ncbi:MAG TPA: ECF transporter S component, partial [Exiguobacterium sp.]|nr:ECF transporter S component [Exiguobacterium sp.]